MPGLNHDRNPTLAALYGLAGAANRIAQAYTVASCAAKEELAAATTALEYGAIIFSATVTDLRVTEEFLEQAITAALATSSAGANAEKAELAAVELVAVELVAAELQEPLLAAAESAKTLLAEARGAGALLGVVESEAVRLARLGLRAEARDAALRSVLLASLRAREAQSVYLQVEKLYREIADKAIALAESDGLSVISSPLSLI